MGTKVHYENSFYSMRNVNEDSNSNSWHLFYGDNALTNSHYYNNFNPVTVTDPYLRHEKDEVKQKMLQHEAIFKIQVHELHRLYRRQRDIMEEVKRKEFNNYQIPIDTSSSSTFMPSQKPYENAQKWQSSRPSIFGVEISNSPISCSKGNDSNDCEAIDYRPSKVRKQLFDLQLPAHQYIDPEEDEQVFDNHASEISSYSHFYQTPSIFTASNGYPFISTSDNLTRKLQKHPSFLSSSSRGHDVSGDRWHGNGCYGNQFFHGASSGSKEPFNYRKKIDRESKTKRIFNGSNFVDLTGTPKCMDLNTVQILSDNEDDSRNCDKKVFPWLKSKPGVSKNGDVSKDDKNPLGFQKFGNFCKNDDSSSMEHRGIDINVAWEDVNVVEETEIKNFKNNFDLNSCVTEDDELLVTESVKSSKKMIVEIDLEAPVSEIEEDAIMCGAEHEKTVELEKIVAEAIVEMSSQQDHVGPAENDDDALLWFVEVMEKHTVFVSRETDEYEMLTLRIEESKEEDYMPMPVPLVPDVQEPEEVGPGPGPRPRRGQARRGRPRRDFQRDIFPGMESLSRHEISEDLQIFGGLMRATGHSWNNGSKKKNGKRIGARGRRRKGKVVEITPATAPPPPPPPMVGLEERRFTGWGKTTRRPQRQRRGVINSVAVQST